MLFRRLTRCEGPKIPSLSGIGVLLPRIQAVLTCFEFPDHLSALFWTFNRPTARMNLGTVSRRSFPCDDSPFLYLVPKKRAGPAGLDFDHLVNLGHEADRLTQGDDDLLVVLNVFAGRGAALRSSSHFSQTW